MFGTRLHTLRKERKLRQEDMAKQLGSLELHMQCMNKEIVNPIMIH